ncbi:Dyp-type peroxidase domain-containing protein [Bradyrhizobium elkanii]|uniref:Dyp-type peroxidase domain-containing protein n=2 Tax=Nitrobacteraceae TaxID=41294 RepID=UPI000685A983|nr:deferrochelatase/peroxidase EfeB [Bradyrhizobium elkanii]
MFSTTQTSESRHRAVDSEPQYIDAPMTASAAFLVLAIDPGDQALEAVRAAVGSTTDLIKDIRGRANSETFTANVGIGHRVWLTLTGKPEPKELTTFREIKGTRHTAISTPGGLRRRSDRRG